MLADYHVHSEFSDDSVFPVNDVCALAIERGIDEICFTDHVDFEIRPDWDEYRADPSCAPISEGQPSINVDSERYFPTIAEARDRFADELAVKTGIEFGVQSHTIGRFDELFERFAGEWDFTILSIHQVGNQEFWNGTFQQGRTQDEYNMGYYEEMLRVGRCCAWCSASTIGRCSGTSTSSSAMTTIRYGLADLTPSTELLRLYRDLGGRILTIGSDSHKPEHLGAHIPMMRERLKDIGWQRLAQARAPRRAHPHDARAPEGYRIHRVLHLPGHGANVPQAVDSRCVATLIPSDRAPKLSWHPFCFPSSTSHSSRSWRSRSWRREL